MARLTSKEIGDIIKRELPGFRLASKSKRRTAAARGASRDSSDTDATTPDLTKLRLKYLGSDDDVPVAFRTNNPHHGAALGADVEEELETAEGDDDVIVSVEPDDRDSLDRGARAKSVVVSAKDKKIIGRQG